MVMTLLGRAQEELDVAGNVAIVGNLSVGGQIIGNINFDAGTLFVNSVNNRVGIGTVTPTYELDVEDNGVATIGIHSITSRAVLDLEGDSDVQINFDTTLREWRMYVDGDNSFGAGAGAFLLRDHTGGASRLVINTAGNVGIGTLTPGSALAVVGLPIHANNAAAIVGGLAAGDFYRTNADPDPVCVVH